VRSKKNRLAAQILFICAIPFAVLQAIQNTSLVVRHVPARYLGMINPGTMTVVFLVIAVLILLYDGRVIEDSPRTPDAPIQNNATQTANPTIILNTGERQQKEAPVRHMPKPNLQCLGFSWKNRSIDGIDIKHYVLRFRNDILVFQDTARDVVAHLNFHKIPGSDTEIININHGIWMESDGRSMYINRADTMHLIMALPSDDGKIIAVEDDAPEYAQIAPAGELTQGKWMVEIIITAENYKAIYKATLEVANGSVTGTTPVKVS
jgi:hypothetical protein